MAGSRLWCVCAVCLLAVPACERAEYVDECLSDADCDDQNGCTSDLCTVGECHHMSFPDGVECNDGDPCTLEDVCESGECKGRPKDCSDYGGVCAEGVCDPQSGECGPSPLPDGTGCDDGLYCTVNDSCREGVCSGNERLCNDGDDCTRDECNEGEDDCDSFLEPRPGAEGPPGDPTCTNGVDDDCDRLVDDRDPNCAVCTHDSDCDDGNICTDDACADSICENTPVADGTGCDDWQYCTQEDECTEGVCGGVARDCSAFADGCHEGVCVEENEACEAREKQDGAVCDDGLYCSVGDCCVGGVCTQGPYRDCDDGDICTLDECNEASDVCDHIHQARPGAEGPPGDVTCGNGVDDDCDGLTDLEDGNCADCTSAAECDDGNPCTEDDCTAGTCTNVNVSNGTGCDDGQYCTNPDTCTGGVCGGPPRNCGGGQTCCPTGCVDLTGDDSNCGACGEVCHTTTHCAASVCVCNSGLGNCDGSDANGCETQLGTISNCGGCGDTCAYAHASEACNGGSCEMGACDALWGDCNTGDGCETSLETLSDCGACGIPCSRSHATATCSGGTCRVSSCDSLWDDCDGIDSTGCETSLETLSDCGACDVPCSLPNATATCSGGNCAIGVCEPLWGNCDGNHANGCEQELTTLEHCGGCNSPCVDDGLYCDGVEQCDGSGNCGSSGTPCPETACNHCNEADDTCLDPEGTPCLDDGNYCTGEEVCNGSGSCVSTGVPCMEIECNHCNEADNTCFDPAGTPCLDDGSYCTGEEVCDGLGYCVSTGNPCMETECNHCNESAMNCFDPEGSPCEDDGLYCNGFELCDGSGNCDHSGDPCVVGEFCLEGPDMCTECRDDDDCPPCMYCNGLRCLDQALGEDLKDDCPLVACLTGDCDGSGQCGYESYGMPCGNGADSECDHPDQCDGGGTCDPNYEPSGTACTCDGYYCNGVEECDGSGACVHSGTPCPETECNHCDENTDMCFDIAGTLCGSFDDNACTDPDTCDGLGTCQPNHELPGTVCDDGIYCNGSDTCNDAGACLNHSGDPCIAGPECNSMCNEPLMDCFDPPATPCGDCSETECTLPDTCDGNGNCLDNHQPNGTPCGTAQECQEGVCM